jgi:hypothetical protein
MATANRQHWIRAAWVAGGGYFIIGRLFAAPTSHVQAWRLAAWAVSGIIYATHIWREHDRRRTSPLVTATHVAVGVAIGGFLLAVAGMIHSLSTSSAIRPIWLLSLVLWPVITALPGFVGAFVAAKVVPRRSPDGTP